MEKMLRGKYLVRKSKLEDGTPVLTLTGTFYPINFPSTDVDDGDEMWISNLIVCSGGVKFSGRVNDVTCSPEDFLEGDSQLSSNWREKDEL